MEHRTKIAINPFGVIKINASYKLAKKRHNTKATAKTMIQLKRTVWNNVIIFAMLLMIFLFNGLHHKIFSSSEPVGVQAILPQGSAILTMEFNDIQIERIGTGWRATKDTDEDLHLLDINWQQATGELVNVVPDNTVLSDTAQFVLAGDTSFVSYSLIEGEDNIVLKDHQGRYLIIDSQTRNQLFPFTEYKK
jgi:hypothetical protein